MVVGDFDFVGMSILPSETDPVLLIDTDTELRFSTPAEALQPIPGRDRELFDLSNPVYLIKLSSGACGLVDGSAVGGWRLPSRFELE